MEKMDTTNGTLRFNVGSLECVAISDGCFTYATANFFPTAPSELLALEFGGSVPQEVISPYTCLAVRADAQWILLDTGAAGMGPTTGNFRANLHVAGIRTSDVTQVVLTHAHPDHIGGVIDADGRLSFPDAQLLMMKQEWDFWSQPDLLSRLPRHLPEMARERQTRTFLSRFPVLKQKVKLVEQEAEVARGIRVLLAPGHTPGHVIVQLRSGRDTLMYISDTVLHPIHLVHPDWRPVYDMDQDEAEKTRRSTLSRIASEGMLVFAFHFQFPEVGHIRSKGEAWSWEPVSEGVF